MTVDNDCPLGSVRKTIGVPFLGETREGEHLYLADVTAEGLNEEKEPHTVHFWRSNDEAV